MNEITEISPQIKDKTRCNSYIDGRFCCGLTLEAVMKNRLKVGQIITEEKLSTIQLESESSTAFDKALTHLSATIKTEKQIRDFLSKKGYLSAVIEQVLEKLRSYNFLNDADYAQTYAQNSVKRKGGKLIKMELRAKGIAEESIQAAIDWIDSEEELETAKTLLAKYMRGKTEDKETFHKAFRYLMGKGFDYEVIRQALSEYTDLDE